MDPGTRICPVIYLYGALSTVMLLARIFALFCFFSVLTRGAFAGFFKKAGEMLRIVIADIMRNFRYGHSAVHKQLLSLINLCADKILLGCFSGNFLKPVAEMALAHECFLRKIF